MPHNTRARLRQQAKQIREVGETIWILTSNKDPNDRSLPLDAFANDAPEPENEDTVTAIYARVTWNTADVSYDETGRALNLKATIEANIAYRALLAGCYAVRFSDGNVLRKTSEKPSDERLSYIVTLSGTANEVG